MDRSARGLSRAGYAACAGLDPPSEFGSRFGGFDFAAGMLRFEAFALAPFDGDLIASSVRLMSARIARNLSAADSPIRSMARSSPKHGSASVPHLLRAGNARREIW